MVKTDEKILQDLQIEFENLEHKVTGLYDFIYYEGQFSSLSLAEQCVLQVQLDVMQAYLKILSARIEMVTARAVTSDIQKK